MTESSIIQNPNQGSIYSDNPTLQITTSKRIFEFLVGLNQEYDQVCGQVLGKEPLPPFSEVFALVRAEESRKSVMLGKTGTSTLENSALAASKSSSNAGNYKGDWKRPMDKDKLWCDYCQKQRHTRDTCWKLHGKTYFGNKWTGGPEGKERNQQMKSGQAHQTTTMEDNHKSSGFSKTDIENLKKLLNQLEGNNANSSQISGPCDWEDDWAY